MTNDEIVTKATEAFFAEVFKYVPPGTSGDLSPGETQAFERAAADVVQAVALNQPARKYVIAYEVEWIPDELTADEDAPLDRVHSLVHDDARITDWRLVGIGSAESVKLELDALAPPLYTGA